MNPKFIAGPPGTGKTHEFITQKYEELFKEDSSRKDFKELIIALKEKIKIPHEKEIRRIRALRNEYSHEYKQIDPNDITFSIEITKKFINEFK